MDDQAQPPEADRDDAPNPDAALINLARQSIINALTSGQVRDTSQLRRWIAYVVVSASIEIAWAVTPNDDAARGMAQAREMLRIADALAHTARSLALRAAPAATDTPQ